MIGKSLPVKQNKTELDASELEKDQFDNYVDLGYNQSPK